MRALAFFGFLLLAGCNSSSSEAPTVPAASEPQSTVAPVTTVSRAADQTAIHGVWKLVSFDQNEADGNVSHPYGEAPVGRLTFDTAGRMSVFVMKPGRVASVNSTGAIPTASAEDLRQIADGFMAYYGSFQVDEEMKVITVKVEACTIPAWTDSEQKRSYELADDTLTLITPATKLTWTRLPN